VWPYLRLDQKWLSRLVEYDDVIRGPLFSLASGLSTLINPPLAITIHTKEFDEGETVRFT